MNEDKLDPRTEKIKYLRKECDGMRSGEYCDMYGECKSCPVRKRRAKHGSKKPRYK